MEQLILYITLLAIIVVIGVTFDKAPVPTSLLLVLTGICLNFIPIFTDIELDPMIVLNVFLPLLLYQISSFSAWKEMKKNIRPIILLSIGHVIFITVLIAITIHYLIPQLGWPLAFLLGAVISPPDDVAIVSIAEKIRMPNRIVTILEGEGMLNDATALTLFRFSLAAALTHQFSFIHAVSTFFIVVVGEIIYGLIVGYTIGKLRLKINDPKIHMIASLLTPFIAYLPANLLGGSGVIATVVTGFVIGEVYAVKFSPEFRLLSRAIWPTLSFAIQSLLFIMIGLNLRVILTNIATIPIHDLVIYASAIIFVVIIGRFIWVYPAALLPRMLIPSIRKKDPLPPWQFPFVISWAGMRGAISLAAALAVPVLPNIGNINPKYLLLYLVFCVIIATLIIQGFTLPWLLKILGIEKHGQREKYSDHILELNTRLKLAKLVLRWLKEYKSEIFANQRLLDEVNLRIKDLQMFSKQLKENIDHHGENMQHDDISELRDAVFLRMQIIDYERREVLRLWHEDEINLYVRNKLVEELDHRARRLSG